MPYGDLRELIRDNAHVGNGIVLDVEGFDEACTCGRIPGPG